MNDIKRESYSTATVIFNSKSMLGCVTIERKQDKKEAMNDTLDAISDKMKIANRTCQYLGINRFDKFDYVYSLSPFMQTCWLR